MLHEFLVVELLQILWTADIRNVMVIPTMFSHTVLGFFECL